VLIREWVEEAQTSADVVYIVTFDSDELHALMAHDKVGIEGYEYAESEKERQASI